ncbi:hypothetical protein PPERSA_01026 [Pseudocohnilembus persalinus]|uniref:Uncharacterized protein n=1 Tax=Pseudocohnilembus persalinus TaxID=266149 RepID=A0A0V0QUB8_PSEPJ|nr:hypothetical protein PPERSA_01026 [Pseudocohnilembus persalinus]|eukprot:KRX05948.1 hypothetical protein PPERSA_01026 [Pseudocohnilembus persalinus]
MELMPIFSVKNLRNFLTEMEKKGEELQDEKYDNFQNQKKQMHLLVTGIEDCNSKIQQNLEEIEKQEQENQRKAKKYVELSELEIKNLEDLKRVGIVLGSEGFGVSQEILDIADNIL